MSDYHRPPTHPKARKQHLCDACLGPIPAGELHFQESGFYDGRAYQNRLHNECRDTLIEISDDYGDGEFRPGELPWPDRLRVPAPQPGAQDGETKL